MEFANLTREFADAATQVSPAGPSTLQYSLVRNRAELDRLTKSLWDAESVGVAVSDPTPTETSDQQCLGYDLAAGIAFSTAAGVSAYVDLENFKEGQAVALDGLREFFANGLSEKSVHDLKRAVGLLARLDVPLEGVKDDTFLAAYLLDPNRSKYELIDLAREALSADGFDAAPAGWQPLQWETALAADLTARTAKVLHERILDKKLETIYSEVELPLAPLLFMMEQAGLKVDPGVLAELSSYLGQELHKLTLKIYELAGREFNIGSPKQVGDVLGELNILSGRKTSTGQSVDE